MRFVSISTSRTLGTLDEFVFSIRLLGYQWLPAENEMASRFTAFSCDLSSNGFTLTESYVLGQGGEQLTTLDQNQKWERTNAYAGKVLLATYDAQGLHFHLSDPLGTRRVQTSAVGEPEETCQGLPFGDGMNCSPASNPPPTADDATPLHFTGKERDTETGNDYFGARYYGSSMGRFMSPDPSGLAYADPTNPQSFNLYAYGMNNPLIYIDPNGLDACIDKYGNVNNIGSFSKEADAGTDSGYVACPEGQTLITTTQQVTAVGFDENGNVNTYSTDSGKLYNADGTPYTIQATTAHVSANDNSFTYIDLNSMYSPGAQSINTTSLGNIGPATNNGPTWKQKNQSCLNQINNTPDGRFYNTFSYASPIFGPDAGWSELGKEGASEGAKEGSKTFLKAAASNWAGTGLGSGSGFIAGAWDKVDGFLFPVNVAATGAQVTAAAGCAISALF